MEPPCRHRARGERAHRQGVFLSSRKELDGSAVRACTSPRARGERALVSARSTVVSAWLTLCALFLSLSLLLSPLSLSPSRSIPLFPQPDPFPGTEAPFIASAAYVGSQTGYVFRKGHSGVGYYQDAQAAAAAAGCLCGRGRGKGWGGRGCVGVCMLGWVRGCARACLCAHAVRGCARACLCAHAARSYDT